MRGTKAKVARRAVYGDLSLKQRTYTWKGNTIHADELRKLYQRTKRLLRREPWLALPKRNLNPSTKNRNADVNTTQPSIPRTGRQATGSGTPSRAGR